MIIRKTFAFFVILAACSGNATEVVDKTGNSYEVRKLSDGLYWTQNLKAEIPGSYCYENQSSNCEKYGRLYTWLAATQVCKQLGAEWRLPTETEWRTLVKQYGGIVNDSGTGTQAFSRMVNEENQSLPILLGGGRDPDSVYRRLEAHGFYWTATETATNQAWLINFAKGPGIVNAHPDIDKERAASVRCVKD